MLLLPDQNFLLESFCFTEYLQFPQKNGINCFIWLGTYSVLEIHGLEFERTSGDHLAQPHCQQRLTYNRMHRTMSRWGDVQKEPLWAAVPVPSGPHSAEIFPHVQMELLMSQLPLILSLWRCSGDPPLRYLCVLVRSLFSFLLSIPSSPSSLSHSLERGAPVPFPFLQEVWAAGRADPSSRAAGPGSHPHSWHGTFRCFISDWSEKPISSRRAESLILLEERPNESVCHFRARINVEFPSHTHTHKKSESYF